LRPASPGGTSANLYSHLADGDVALNISLTAINSALSIVTLPLFVNWSLAHFFSEGQAIPLQFAKVMQVFVIVLGPVLIGMWLRSRFPAFAERMARPVEIFSMLFLFAVVAVALIQEWQTLLIWGPVRGSRHARLQPNQFWCRLFRAARSGHRKAPGNRHRMEIGIHNGTLAIAIALSPVLLDNATMAVPLAIYGLIAFITAAAEKGVDGAGGRKQSGALNPTVRRAPRPKSLAESRRAPQVISRRYRDKRDAAFRCGRRPCRQGRAGSATGFPRPAGCSGSAWPDGFWRC
jgi:predicted Na+-dependent transporter